jgi:hypothetical protein
MPVLDQERHHLDHHHIHAEAGHAEGDGQAGKLAAPQCLE